MFARLRSRSLLSGLLSLFLVISLVVLVLAERLENNARVDRLSQIEEAAGQARELSLYVQYNAHDTNAYTLGHLEHRQEFIEHADAFQRIVADLQREVDTGNLSEEHDQDLLDLLGRIKQTREEYDRASQRLFAAADANRENPSPENQAKEDSAWEAADKLGDELDEKSQELASHLRADAEAIETKLERRNALIIPLVIGIGAVIAALIAYIQRRVSRAEESRSQLAAIVEAAQDAIIGTTLSGTITTWNSGAEKLYGYSAEEAMDQHVSILVPPDQSDGLPEILERARRGENTNSYETVRVAKDGRRIDVAITVFPIKDSAGNVVSAAGITRDIAERKRYEEELQQAKEAAEAANRAKSEFLANMSHEIRTPMNGVIGMTGLLLDTDLSPEQREYAETVRVSGENLLTIINDIRHSPGPTPLCRSQPSAATIT